MYQPKTEIPTWHAQTGTHHENVLERKDRPLTSSLSRDIFYNSGELDCPGTSGHPGDWFPFLGQLTMVSLLQKARGWPRPA